MADNTADPSKLSYHETRVREGSAGFVGGVCSIVGYARMHSKPLLGYYAPFPKPLIDRSPHTAHHHRRSRACRRIWSS